MVLYVKRKGGVVLPPIDTGPDSSSITWKDYVDIFLVANYASKMSIHSADDCKTWANSKNFHVHAAEVRDILAGFENSADLRLRGIMIAGMMFTLTRISGQSIMVGRNARTTSGCVIYRTKMCVLVVVYEEGTHAGECYNTVLKCGDYLVDRGY